jgi:predicted HTH domain antitoxin
MMTTVTLEIPGEVLHTTRLTQAQLKVELAVHLFEQGRLSFGKARELAGMDAWRLMQVLGSRDIPIHYDVEEFEEDLATLERLGRK